MSTCRAMSPYSGKFLLTRILSSMMSPISLLKGSNRFQMLVSLKLLRPGPIWNLIIVPIREVEYLWMEI
jgi:hypothetical protein